MKKLFSNRNEGPKDFVINGKYYIVESCLAQGGFGIVYLIRSEIDGCKYALKRMFVNDVEKLSICKFEIDITRRFAGNKNIVKYFDSLISSSGQGIDEVLILLKYYKNNVLSEMNRCKSFTESEILSIFCGVCEAIAQLHYDNPPVIHRDIKIENLLLDEIGNSVLCDFGSSTTRVLNPAKDGALFVEEELAKYTTLSYRSPEMIDLFMNRDITIKSDIWALGCLLYRLCFFSLPFNESTMLISAASFTIPQTNIYSENMLKLINYMLNSDSILRPNIFQVSYLAFKMANKLCPVKNLENSVIPDFNSLPMPKQVIKNSESKTRSKSQGSYPISSTTVNTTTSINKRERPRPHHPQIDQSSINSNSSNLIGNSIQKNSSIEASSGTCLKKEPNVQEDVSQLGNSIFTDLQINSVNRTNTLLNTVNTTKPLISIDSHNKWTPIITSNSLGSLNMSKDSSHEQFNRLPMHIDTIKENETSLIDLSCTPIDPLANPDMKLNINLFDKPQSSLYTLPLNQHLANATNSNSYNTVGFNNSNQIYNHSILNDIPVTQPNNMHQYHINSRQPYTHSFNRFPTAPFSRNLPLSMPNQRLSHFNGMPLNYNNQANRMILLEQNYNVINANKQANQFYSGFANQNDGKSGSANNISASVFTINKNQFAHPSNHRRNVSDTSAIKMNSIHHPHMNLMTTSFDPFQPSTKTKPNSVEDVFGALPFNPTELTPFDVEDQINLLQL